MISSTPAPLVFFRVLAERSGKPAGLLIDVGAGDAAAVLPLFDTGPFLGLGGAMASFYRPLVDPAVGEGMTGGGEALDEGVTGFVVSWGPRVGDR